MGEKKNKDWTPVEVSKYITGLMLKFMHECEVAKAGMVRKQQRKKIHSIFFELQLLPLLQLLNLGILHCHFSISFSLLLIATVAFHCFPHQFPKDNLPATQTQEEINDT